MQRAIQQPISAKRVLRYVGKDSSAVDPYWDFEHLPGELFDGEALRLWRLRVFVSKPARARLLLIRTEDAPKGAQGEPSQHRLAADEHVLHYHGGPERDATSYGQFTGPVVDVAPPSTTFVVNLTRLDPGIFVARANVLGAQQQQREMRFRIVRRPFYTYPGLMPGKVPVVRSYTGSYVVERHGERVSIAGYRWPVVRHEWDMTAYRACETRQIRATLELGSRRLDWEIEDGAGGPSAVPLAASAAMSTYASPEGTGLSFPRLTGLYG